MIYELGTPINDLIIKIQSLNRIILYHNNNILQYLCNYIYINTEIISII